MLLCIVCLQQAPPAPQPVVYSAGGAPVMVVPGAAPMYYPSTQPGKVFMLNLCLFIDQRGCKFA